MFGNGNGLHNVVIMRQITDRLTPAKSVTQDFTNKLLCSGSLWGIYKEG